MLDDKIKELVAVGAAITANCQPCLEYHSAKARELGVADDDIFEAIKVAQQVRRGATAKIDRFAAEHVSGQKEVVAPAGCECR
jgi:AhpD family alkylhydroperoxidase